MAGSNTSSQVTRRSVGRPTVFSDETLRKLNEAFAFGASDPEACFYADVSTTALYNYQLKHPEFVERKNALKERPVLLARQTVVKALESDADLALKFLERKRKAEFSTKTETDTTIHLPTPILGNVNVQPDNSNTQNLIP